MLWFCAQAILDFPLWTDGCTKRDLFSNEKPRLSPYFSCTGCNVDLYSDSLQEIPKKSHIREADRWNVTLVRSRTDVQANSVLFPLQTVEMTIFITRLQMRQTIDDELLMISDTRGCLNTIQVATEPGEPPKITVFQNSKSPFIQRK